MPNNDDTTLTDFLDKWTTDANKTKISFLKLKEYLAAMADVEISFVPRPGITYSLRANHPAQQGRNLFVMVDVIDDDPEDRWLSVAFYKDMVTDPEEQADEVPEGLLGEDAYCFDLYEGDEDMEAYLMARLNEARQSAAATSAG